MVARLARHRFDNRLQGLLEADRASSPSTIESTAKLEKDQQTYQIEVIVDGLVETASGSQPLEDAQ